MNLNDLEWLNGHFTLNFHYNCTVSLLFHQIHHCHQHHLEDGDDTLKLYCNECCRRTFDRKEYLRLLARGGFTGGAMGAISPPP